MIQLYFFEKRRREEIVPGAIREYAGRNCDILKTDNGKPYIEGDPFFISLSHSENLCTFAISPINVGIDTEIIRDANFNAVLSSFSAQERKEIKCPRDFFMHWTAREAYVKFCGEKIWDLLKKLSFTGGRLYLSGLPVPQKISFCFENGAVTAICADNADFEIKTLQ